MINKIPYIFRNKPGFPKRKIRERNANSKPTIISVGGGKGGIGKTFITANICARLTQEGFKVAAIDLDLGAANLHTCFGIQAPQKNISDFFQGHTDELEKTGVETLIEGLTLFGGGHTFWQHISPQGGQKIKLINCLQNLDYDYIVIDLGAGTHVHTLDFFIFSDLGLMIMTPEPTSIENAYVFLKSILYRKLQNISRITKLSPEAERNILNKITKYQKQSSPINEIEAFLKNELFFEETLNLIHSTNVGIIMNQVRTKEDKALGKTMATISHQYFGFSSKLVGSMNYDDSVWKSIRIRKPLVVDNPYASSSSQIYKIVDQIIEMTENKSYEEQLAKSS